MSVSRPCHFGLAGAVAPARVDLVGGVLDQRPALGEGRGDLRAGNRRDRRRRGLSGQRGGGHQRAERDRSCLHGCLLSRQVVAENTNEAGRRHDRPHRLDGQADRAAGSETARRVGTSHAVPLRHAAARAVRARLSDPHRRSWRRVTDAVALLRTARLAHDPGSRPRYHDPNYWVAARVVEAERPVVRPLPAPARVPPGGDNRDGCRWRAHRVEDTGRGPWPARGPAGAGVGSTTRGTAIEPEWARAAVAPVACRGRSPRPRRHRRPSQ